MDAPQPTHVRQRVENSILTATRYLEETLSDLTRLPTVELQNVSFGLSAK